MDIATIVILVLVLLFVVGMGGSFVLTQMVAARIDASAAGKEELAALVASLQDLRESNDKLHDEVTELRSRVDSAERLLGPGG